LEPCCCWRWLWQPAQVRQDLLDRQDRLGLKDLRVLQVLLGLKDRLDLQDRKANPAGPLGRLNLPALNAITTPP
jgi:hypothetical protein